MAMDATEIVLVAVGMLFCLAAGWVVGRLFDPTWKVKRMRQILHSNTFMLGIVSRDKKTINKVAANLDGAIFKVGDYNWVIDHTRIYREDKPQSGFFMTKNHVKWEEGVPTLYVYEDSLKPAEFNSEPSKVPPGEIGSALVAFVAVELAKGFQAIKEYKTFFYVIMGLCLLIAIGLIVVYGAADAATKNAAACVTNTNTIIGYFNIPPPSNDTNSTKTTVTQTSNGNTVTIHG